MVVAMTSLWERYDLVKDRPNLPVGKAHPIVAPGRCMAGPSQATIQNLIQHPWKSLQAERSVVR
jgi:hypothetical protein